MITTSSIGADLLSGWIEDGTAARIADWKRHEGAARQAIARRVLDRPAFSDASVEPAHLAGAAGTMVVRRIRCAGPHARRRAQRLVGVRCRHRAAEGRALVPGDAANAGSLEQALARVGECLIDRAPTARAVV